VKRAILLLIAASLGAGSLSFGASSCITQGVAACTDASGNPAACACPSESVFTGIWPDGGPPGAAVSEYMTRRCGTLDCHGTETRPMRLYGRLGLRDPLETNVSGGKATTPLELTDSYAAVCNVEPEATQAAVEDQGASGELLLIVQKARGIEAHKGGQVVTQGSPGDNCIAGWLREDDSATVAAACQAAINGL